MDGIKLVSMSVATASDLIDCKSKVEDMKMLIDEWSVQLKEIGLLDKMADILYSRRYSCGESRENG